MLEKKFRVRDLLLLGSLEGVQVIAGRDQLGNIIHNINVMEVPDVEDWVQKEEFLMTTGYMYRDQSERFLSLIPRLKERGVAALGIKPKRYLEEIPPRVIRCADKYGLPLLALPPQTAFSLVIREVMEKILLSDLRKEERIVYQMLHPEPGTKKELLNSLEALDIHVTDDMVWHIILPLEHEKEFLEDAGMIKQELRDRMGDCHVRLLSMEHEMTTVLVCIADNEAVWNALFFADTNPFTDLAKRYGLSFFISESQNDILRLNETFADVQSLLFAARPLSLHTPVVTWQSLGIYSALPFLDKTPFGHYAFKKYIAPLLEYDKKHGTSLFDTVHIYVSCNGNMRAAARELYIHYNTMCYRMNLVREHFHFELSDIDEMTGLNLAFKLYEKKE